VSDQGSFVGGCQLTGAKGPAEDNILPGLLPDEARARGSSHIVMIRMHSPALFTISESVRRDLILDMNLARQFRSQ
jgi:hypothetical protein